MRLRPTASNRPPHCPHCRRHLSYDLAPHGPDRFKCDNESCHGGYPRPEYQHQARVVADMHLHGPQWDPGFRDPGSGERITIGQHYDRYAQALWLEEEMMAKFGIAQ